MTYAKRHLKLPYNLQTKKYFKLLKMHLNFPQMTGECEYILLSDENKETRNPWSH